MLKLIWYLFTLLSVIHSSKNTWLSHQENEEEETVDITCMNNEEYQIIQQYYILSNNGSINISNVHITDSNFSTISTFYFPNQIYNKLEISNSQIRHIGNNAFEFFYKLKELDLHNNHLKNMSFLESLPPQIHTINLSGNDFETLPSINVHNNVRYFDVSRCKIKHVENDLLKYYNFYLNISYNQINIITLPLCTREFDISFNNLEEIHYNNGSTEYLHFVNVSNSRFRNVFCNFDYSNIQIYINEFYAQNISTTESCLFPKFITVKSVLDLSNNNIENIHSFFNNSHNNLKNLEHLTLALNQIQIIKNNTFNFSTNLKILNLSHNLIKIIEPNAFDNLYSLEYLNLKDNEISFLEPGIFKQTKALIQIDLSFNLIQHISNNLLNKHISVLNLSNCQIQKVENNLLILQNVSQLDLSNNQLKDISFVFPNSHTKLILKGNSITNLEVLHMPNSSLPSQHLTINVDLSNSNLNQFPNISIKTYKNIELNLSNNNIASIKPNTISSLIESLDLSHNNIESFSSTPFENEVNKLKFLYISMIGDFPSKPFRKMNNLQYLQLYDSCISFSKYFFYGLVNLIELNFHNVEVTGLKPGVFIGLYNIQRFKVHLLFENQTVIEKNIFTGLNSLLQLNLTNLQIREIEGSDSFNGLTSLCNLMLKQNKIKVINNNTFATLNLLEHLDLSFNFIAHLDVNTFIGLNSLIKLSLENNTLEYISIGTFKPLKNLQKLNLRHNQIYSISSGVFSYLQKLTNLDLSYNNMSRLEATVFSPLKKLKVLDLSGNHLIQIKYEYMADQLKSLRFIGLNNNKWRCTRLAQMLKLFESRNIAWTPLTDSSVDFEENIDGIRCIDICKFLYCDETHAYD